MAEEEVVAASPGLVPSDHKRKLEDIEPQAPPVEMPLNSAVDPDATASDSSEAKRPRLVDEKTDGLASENGFKAEQSDEPVKEEEEAFPQNEVTKQAEDGTAQAEEAQETAKPQQVEGTTKETEQQSTDNHATTDAELGKDEKFEADGGQEPGKVENFGADGSQEPPTKEESKQPSNEVPQQEVDDGSTITRRIEVPNAKIGVLIGKAGDTIRYLQYNSGAKIQITRDADADRDAPTRPVEIIGTLNSIIKAEKLINAVIAEADAGGSPSLVARGLATTQAAGDADHIEMQVPNEKVGLIIGRGGETIRGMQTRSGARIQLIPQHLPEGDESKERIVRVTGDKRQIEIAREMIKDVMSQNARLSPLSGGFNQQGNRPRGNTGPPQWGSFGHTVPTASYDFQRRRPYPSQNSHYQPPYGGYPSHQMAPRSNFGSSWEQRPHNFQGPPHSGGYNYYSRHGSVSVLHLASIHGHGPRPTPAPAMGAVSSQSSYNYGQPHGRADYAHPPPYSHAFHQHSYGNGYGEKYENHTPVLHPYGEHGSSQPGYAPPGPQSAYAPQQQYGKPYSYVQSQGPQTYGPPANQPGEVPYQGPTGQSYSPNVPPQQQYPYASGPLQQSYPPCGSAPPGDGYNQPPPVTGQAYSQQGGQSVPGYSQPSAQQATAYAQANTAAGYGQYPPSQQGYSDQAAPNNAAYGYQGTQDSGYGSGPVTTYGAAPSGQVTYAQPTATQATYDQSGGYAAAPVSAPVAYGNTVSPQLGYPQYDSTQIFLLLVVLAVAGPFTRWPTTRYKPK
ncbi:far upstream element-binding protein 3 isoform X6 [Gossypium hirsutum]|uniref:Far upstream element-binding protein 3 isoform X6 n=1 Tax=Gossypium hirsutum TaxID=3635 RepID=A0A1U8K6T9_GOSHI|nr:far upstream element-binding protein 3 isoform X6 [Gossypium hirsutum]